MLVQRSLSTVVIVFLHETFGAIVLENMNALSYQPLGSIKFVYRTVLSSQYLTFLIRPPLPAYSFVNIDICHLGRLWYPITHIGFLYVILPYRTL